jgi:2-C-methyl-D-erythritol 4-phosphate cytidylyltransferase/2-C-methyl-D-erythritol 2,4-cyclodiphosphate synthase
MKPQLAHTPDLNFHVVIAAAGQGLRFGSKIPKQYSVLAGKSMLRHAVERFIGLPGLQSITIIIQPEHTEYYHQAIKGISLAPPVMGGAERSISIRNALNALSSLRPDDIVLIHDAARPLIQRHDILNLINALHDHDAATLASPVADTLRRGDDNNTAHESINRDKLWAIQTPQAFRAKILKKAHESIEGIFTDDTSIVSALGTDVKIVNGSRSNIKITRPDDFEMAEKLLMHSTETRTGMGYDVHAFSKNPNRALMLCGIKIDHPFGLEGHSDADVGLHALTDAILGSIGSGDIGQHFPPSKSEFKDMDSAIFLEKACAMLRAKGGSIINADITLICETPKIGPHRDAMQKRVADILAIDVTRVNIKATTTEGLGFTGRGEGIAAQAIVNIKIPS